MVATNYVDSFGRTSEDREALRAKIDRINADAMANWDDPQWRRTMAQEMTETILEGFDHENLLSRMANVENADFNGRIFVSEVRGLRAHWVARGGYIEASTLKKETMELPRDTIGIHVYEFEDKIRTNFAETQSTMIDLAQERMDAEVNLRVLALFQEAIPSGHDSYVAVAVLDLASLNTALREVRDEQKSNDVAIVGRSGMTDQIYDLLLGTDGIGAGFIPETNETLIRRGVVCVYRGATIITLINHKDADDISFFPGNELYVLGRDASKFAFWGGLLSREWSEQDAWYWHYMARRDFGGIVHRPERARRIVDSTVSA
jgi:hypothetical protein